MMKLNYKLGNLSVEFECDTPKEVFNKNKEKKHRERLQELEDRNNEE